MKYYFQIQWQRFQRKLQEAGMNPFFAIVVAFLFFLGLVASLLGFADKGQFILVTIALLLVQSLNTLAKKELLLLIFSQRRYYFIRCIENVVAALPFFLSLLVYQFYWLAVSMMVLSILMIAVPPRKSLQFVIPTPFSRIPFESIVGFRKWWILLVFIYFLFTMGMQVDNFNLSIACIPLLTFLVMFFYYPLEDEFIVWNYRRGYSRFIRTKLIQSTITYSMVGLIPLIILLLKHPEMAMIILLVWIVGAIYLWLLILTKYAAYPHEFGVMQAIYLAIALWFPVSLLYFFPEMNKQAKKQFKKLHP